MPNRARKDWWVEFPGGHTDENGSKELDVLPEDPAFSIDTKKKEHLGLYGIWDPF